MPGTPEVGRVGRDSVDLTWAKPRNDGGSPIKGYQIEKKRRGGSWERVNDRPSPGESFTVPDLDEGEEYEFRVSAITDAGVGDPSYATAPTKVEDKKGKKKPEFNKKPSSTTAPIGGDAVFEVEASGHPKPEVRWLVIDLHTSED